MPPPDERFREIDIFAKNPRPGERAKSSAWATCLGVSRATAIKPDAAYVLQIHEGVKFLDGGTRCTVAEWISPTPEEAMCSLTRRTDISKCGREVRSVRSRHLRRSARLRIGNELSTICLG